LSCAGQVADGLSLIDEAIARFEHTEERWLMTDLLRPCHGNHRRLQRGRGEASRACSKLLTAEETEMPRSRSLNRDLP
jgi:hypothetical protein